MKREILRLSIPPRWRFSNICTAALLLTVLISSSFTTQAQITVQGKISDESGVEMPGVNIVVKGTTTGTTSDVRGNYSLDVPSASSVLVYSFIGYLAEEITVGDQSTINVKLSPSVESLSEIVVVGYGTQKRSDVTGAMTTISSKTLSDVPVANVTQALQGRAAGVDIQTTNSRPGGGAQIRIRGSRSFTATNDPLIVVDGIPFSGTINDINPSDIASLDVLKDASATAIYGSRGSNGVILITSKRGKEGKTQVYYDGYHGVSSAVGKYKVMNGQEYADMRLIAGATPTAEEAVNIAAGQDVDWQDEMYTKGYITSHTVGASGGTSATTANLSANYFKQTTVIPGQAFTRYSIQGVIDQKVGERIKLGIVTKNQFNITDGETISTMFSLLTLSPSFNAYNPDGSIKTLPAIGSPSPERINPLLVKDQSNWKEQRRRLRTFNSLYGEVQILEGLKYRINVGLDFWQDNYGNYSGSNTPYRSGGANGADVQNTNAWSYTIENLLNYDKTFGKHKIAFTGLYSVQETEEYKMGANSTSLPADYMYYYNLSLGTSSVPLNAGNNYYRKSGLRSYMGRLNYNFNDRYLITLTGRADGSSRLAPGNKWFYYPAAALGWNLHNESFLSDVKAVSNFKLRAGIGATGNQGVDPYASLGTLAGLDGRTAEPYNYGANGAFGYLVTGSPNPYLKWEYTTTTNIGLDFGLFSNRISGSVEFYQQNTSRILQRVALPQTSGVGSVTKNVGESSNKGIELTLSTVNVEMQSGFTWSTDFNVAINRNEVTKLNLGVSSDPANAWFVGQPIDVIYDYEKIGIWQNDETPISGGKIGEIKVKDQITDVNNDGVEEAPDGVINAADRVILGTTNAKWSGGLTNRINFKGFDLNVVLFWRVGGLLVSNFYQGNASNPINSLEGRTSGPKVDYWTPDNPTNKYPRPGLASQSPAYGSTMGYFDASYMKIRSMQFGYTIPTDFLTKTGLTSANIYIQAQNPFKAFFSDYVKEGGLDPETNGRGGASANTVGYGDQRLTVNINTPPTRSFIIGVNIKY